MTQKKSRIIKYIKVKLVSVFLMIDIRLIIFYLGLKIEQN